MVDVAKPKNGHHDLLKIPENPKKNQEHQKAQLSHNSSPSIEECIPFYLDLLVPKRSRLKCQWSLPLSVIDLY
jgi:hypothetical protein